MPQEIPYSTAPPALYRDRALPQAAEGDNTGQHSDGHHHDPVRSLVHGGLGDQEPRYTVGQDPAFEHTSPVLNLGWDRRRNLVALRTVLAVVFVVCLGLDLGGVAPQRPQANLLERAGELGSPAFLGQVSLGAMFVLTGMSVTHFYLRRRPGTVWLHLVAQTGATLVVTALPGLVLIALLWDMVSIATAVKVAAAVLPAWVLGCVSIAVVFRSDWAKARITRIAPALMVAAMLVAFVVSGRLSEHAPVVGSTLWADPTFSWAQTGMCTAHLTSYFFAGAFAVSVGDQLLGRTTVHRILLPVIGVVVFVVALPLAMAGLDVGPPFLALALLPLVKLRMPSMLAGRDLWIGLVLYGWPVHLVLVAVGATQRSPLGSAVLGAALALIMAAISWRFAQRPLAKKLTGRAPRSQTRSQPEAEPDLEVGSQSARFRLLAVAEADRLH